MRLMLFLIEIKSDTLIITMSRLNIQHSLLIHLRSNTIIDTQNVYCPSSKVAVARSAKKPAKK